MKTVSRCISAMWFTLPLLLMACVAACSVLRDEMTITFVNKTSEPLVLMALELGTSHLVDPNPTLTINALPDVAVLLVADADASLEENQIMGYSPGDDIVLLVYEIAGNEAQIKGGPIVTHEELKKRNFHVVITSLLPVSILE